MTRVLRVAVTKESLVAGGDKEIAARMNDIAKTIERRMGVPSVVVVIERDPEMQTAIITSYFDFTPDTPFAKILRGVARRFALWERFV